MSTNENMTKPVVQTVLVTCHNDGCGHEQELDKHEARARVNRLFCEMCGSSKVSFAPLNEHRKYVRNELTKFYAGEDAFLMDNPVVE